MDSWTWRRVNAVLAVFSAILLTLSVVLWLWAWLGGFIGNTEFIGHVSMLAIVLACAGFLSGSLAAWRVEVPTNEGGTDG
jgi:Co/Zn/Cd efflux system component